MSVQRWDIDAVASPSEDGAFVTHEAHQSSLAEREQRIAELTALIRELADNEDWVEDTVGIWQDKARAALAATEGETK